MSSKTIFAILWTLVSVNVITLVVGGLVTWLGYSIPVRLKQIGLLPELVITAGFASLVVACIGLGALNYSSYHALNVYGVLCTICALLLIFGIPENWYKSNQFAHTLLLDIIYFTLLFILLVLLGFAFTFAHYLRKKELEVELFGESSGQQNLGFPLNRNTNLNRSIKQQQHSIVGSNGNGNNINQQERPQQQLQLQLQPQSLSQHQNQQQNNNCTCNSQNFFLNADTIGNNNNTSVDCPSSVADKWCPNGTEDVSVSNTDRTNIQQQFQANNTSQFYKNNTANNHTYNGYHSSNLGEATNLASFVASSNTLDARQLSAARRKLQLANLALSTSNLNFHQQQQQQPFILSDIGNIIQDDDKQLLLDSCSFLAPQEFVHKGFYQRDSIADSANSSTLVRARSCSRMPNGIGIDDYLANFDADAGVDFLDVQDCESQDYDHDHDDDNNCSDTDDEIGINDANEVHIELRNIQSRSNSQENRRRRLNLGKTLPDEVLDCATSNFDNNISTKTQNSLRTRHRPWQALNLVPSNCYGSSRDDSSIHYTNASRKCKQLIEEQLFYPKVRSSNSSNNNNENQLYQHRHHLHLHHHHRHHKHHKQQCSEKRRQFHQINPKQHSQSSFSHSPNYSSHKTQLLFPFPSHQYQSATMAKQATCRCNQIVKISASGSNIAATSTSGTSTANTASATTISTSTSTTATTTLTTTVTTTTTSCLPSTIVAQGLGTINSNQGKHLKANPSPYTAPILLNNSTSSFIIKTNKPKSVRSTKDSGSNSANTAEAMFGRSQDLNSSSLTLTVNSKDDGMVIDDAHLFVGHCPIGLDNTEPTMDNYGANLDNVVAKNEPKINDTICTTNTITSKTNCHHLRHHHQLDPSMLA